MRWWIITAAAPLEPGTMWLIFAWLFIINLVAFVLFGIDKRQAMIQRRRLPESLFFVLAWLGAVPGLWFGMQAYRHKTRHARFRFGLPLILLIQLAALIWWLSR
ncbi:MAG: DUF1294 domain-containing protein [Eubacteriales bacterium]|nr:DUF1294 domain-containing protein [Eubacteriales bacterium]